MTTYKLTSAKGEYTGSLESCVAEQRELQGSFAEIARLYSDGATSVEVPVDDDHIDWTEDDAGVVAQVEHAMSIE